MIFDSAAARNAGSEVETADIAPIDSLAEKQAPQSFDADRHPIGAAHCAKERPRLKVKTIDAAVSEIPDQNGTAKVAERCWCLHHRPRRVERTVGGEAA